MYQVVFVDGNGLYHPRRCGLASHLGVISNTPTIGISKSYLYIPKDGIDTEYLLKIKVCKKNYFFIRKVFNLYLTVEDTLK